MAQTGHNLPLMMVLSKYSPVSGMKGFIGY